MEAYELGAIVPNLKPLKLSPNATEADHDAAMRPLGTFNECMTGLLRFEGQSPWERHPQDELLMVLDGAVELTLLADDGRHVTESLGKDSVAVVPSGVWHRQHARAGVTLFFVTASGEDDVSWADDPRSADDPA
ncbi:MAG: cupin domain-containing protein [bacterium]|nr:cupin domain-containing protein [bacterium]